MEAAFSEQERSVILTTPISGGSNPQYGTATGNDTEDAVFLLDIQEAEMYLPSDEERICSPTAFAVSSEKDIVLNEGGNSKWWLRSPGKSNLCAASVFSGGGINFSGYDVRDTTGTVRPALWVGV